MKINKLLTVSLLVLTCALACQKKEETEYIFPLLGKGGNAESLEVKILAQNIEKISLDDEIVIESATDEKPEGQNLRETKSTSLNVSCEAPGIKSENKKSRLTRNKKYRFLQLVPMHLISKRNLNLQKNFSCMFSFSYQKNKVKDLGPLVIDNSNYSGNLPLRKGAMDFPKDSKDVILPHQVNEVQFDFPSGRAVTTTLVCDQFVSREDLLDIRYFQLSQLIYKGTKSVNSNLAGAQNCRLVIEALDQSEEIFISKSFLLVFKKENLALDFSTGFSMMTHVAKGNQVLFTLVISNPNYFAVEVKTSHLPQQVIWQPVYGIKNGNSGGPIYVLKTNTKSITWHVTEAEGSVSGTDASFVVGSQQKAVLSGSASIDVSCGASLHVQQFGPAMPLVGYLVELDSNKVDLSDFFQGAQIGGAHYPLDGPLQTSFAGNKKWISIDGIDYTQRANWFKNGIVTYRGTDNLSREARHCTDGR